MDGEVAPLSTSRTDLADRRASAREALAADMASQGLILFFAPIPRKPCTMKVAGAMVPRSTGDLLMTSLTLPDYGLNGSGATNLLNDAVDAAEALKDALAALRKMMPHGRDYQLMPAGACSEARVQHAARILKVDSVLAEVEALAIDASKQRGCRA